MQKKYTQLMKSCIKLAKKAEGQVSPNPLVGCIIFDDNFKIISKGYHKKYGENHAERNAILNCKEDLRDKNLIVNLEPCSHWGKNPPCSDLIIEKGIKKVIIGMQDPNPIVAGNGIRKLKEAGIEVIVGVLEDECKKLNKIFIKNQLEKKPFITIKTATTMDGKIATSTGNSKWITDEISRQEVHKLRNAYDAILTTSSTVIKDNPEMTCRIKNGRNPIRIVVDTNLKTDFNSKIYNNDNTRIILVSAKNAPSNMPKHIEFIKCTKYNNQINLKEMFSSLYKQGIKSILIEAGGIFNNSVITENHADCLIQFIAPKILSDANGINFTQGTTRKDLSLCNELIIESTKLLKNDIMITSYFKHNGEAK